MDQDNIQTEQEQVQYQPSVVQDVPIVQNIEIKPKKSHSNMFWCLFMAIVIFVGVNAYLLRDKQAKLQNDEAIARIKDLEAELRIYSPHNGVFTLEESLASRSTSSNSTNSSTNTSKEKQTTSALKNAQSVQNFAEIYNADNGYYPEDIFAFKEGTVSMELESTITVLPGLPGEAGKFIGNELLNAANGKTSVSYACLITCNKSSGGRIAYWDYSTNARSKTIIYVGAATSTSTFVSPK